MSARPEIRPEPSGSAGKSAVGVVDYGRGNLRSVENALSVAGARVVRVTSADAMENVDAVVLPGVGAFGDCARNLRERGLETALKEWLSAGRPYLGICLGYQLLFESSEESPGACGLGVFPGRVVRFPAAAGKIPHMGWNAVRPCGAGGRLFEGCPQPAYVYFVHSYFPVPEEASLVGCRCTYGVEFAAGITKGRITATQFHPEKSQGTGLRILRNFLADISR